MKQKPLFTIVYEDDYIAAVNKMSGLSVGGDRWDASAERLDKLLAGVLHIERVFTVHRIDKDTSGLVVFAKDSETHKALSAAFEGRLIEKKYIAACHGRPSWAETLCELPLVPNGNKQHLTIIDKYRGKKSLTRFRLLGSAGNYSIVEAIPESGRTHQIRIHLASLGHPIACDDGYGTAKPIMLSAIKRGWRGDALDEKPILARLGLHAAELIIPNYLTGGGESREEKLVLKAPLPRDMAALITQMEKAAGISFCNN
jgi:23S rRNA pseudouridine1911/1915/1917 synthase